MSKSDYQLIIIGGGPAGLTAAIYAGRSQLKTLLVTAQEGGSINWAHQVHNFPGHIEINGQELGRLMTEQAKKWGTKTVKAEIAHIKKKDGRFTVQTNEDKIYQADSILLALGTQKRKLNLPNEEKFIGRGLSYCALCDGQFFKGKKVAVCGSGDAAATTVIYLADIVEKVYLIARRLELKCNPSWHQTIREKNNIALICENEIEALIGEDSLAKIKLKKPFQNETDLEVSGLFVEIGSMPASLLARQLNLELDQDDFIKVAPSGQTSQLGVWAAGDITTGSNKLQQAITACAEGAIAADDIYRFIKGKP